MSARVFNPVAMELRRAMRGGGANAAAAAAAAAAASAPATAEPCSQALARVRRNLFGPVDHEETRRFVEQELALMSQRDEELYEFDFVRERPRDGPPRRFLWERVRPGAVPVSYALRRLDFLGATAAGSSTAASAAAPIDAAAPPPSAAPAPATASGPAPDTTTAVVARPPCTPATTRTRQSHIDDFMRARKRPRSSDAEGGKAEGPAPKQQRKAASTTTTSSSSSATSATAATAAASRS